MKFKKRSDFENQYDWLWYLYNNLGCSELALQMSGKLENGDIWFSKRYFFANLLELEPQEYIKLGNSFSSKSIKVIDFINNATHRTILDIEIVFDVDEEPILETAINILKKYKQNNPICYFTGSKSYHIHIFDQRLRNKKDLQKNKGFLLYLRNSDEQKAHSTQLIAMEGGKHYKSQKIKKEVKLIE